VVLAVGLLIAAAAWLLPANLKSVGPVLLREAGSGTPSLSEFGRSLVDVEKVGPAELVLAAARACNDSQAPALAKAIDDQVSRQPTFAAWGGWDPFLDPIFNLRKPTGHGADTPILTLFIPQAARDALRTYLADSGSMGVQDLLALRGLTSTGRFAPANRPGGQPLDALILLSALLYQGDHLSPSLERELRNLAETAAARRDLGDLGNFYLDLLSLGRRLNWTQLAELLRRTDSIRTVGEYAQLSRAAPSRFSEIYAAALFTDSADKVAAYLLQYGQAGSEDLQTALSYGQGAVQQLLLRQVPVNRNAGPALSDTAALVLSHPQLMLAIKYLGYFLGLLLIIRGLDRLVVTPGIGRGALPVRASVLALGLAALFIISTEPFLLRASAPSPDYQFHLRLPMLAVSGAQPAANAPVQSQFATMNTSTIVSIAFFALLQVVMYFICLKKINSISDEDVPSVLKLRLMENEENLFDSGLYVGMMGTAAALVLQVLGVIAPNLLAAYSSNLFGIVCVALVKIRHVRAFKRQLILENESQARAT
jgi:hypothetical protein